MGSTKIFPSPILPVLAALAIVSITLSAISSGTATSTTLGKINGVLASSVDFGMSFLSAESFCLQYGHALNSNLERASLMSSSLNGLMMALINFIFGNSRWLRD